VPDEQRSVAPVAPRTNFDLAAGAKEYQLKSPNSCRRFSHWRSSSEDIWQQE
jgi:hypothetical protein